ncbi:hypothetical protein SFUMM280S_04789 [Streptomyces fumanus]
MEAVMAQPLRERADVLALLAAEAERVRGGSGRLVLLRGATGTGRTAVLEAAAAYAEDRGIRVLRARCSPQETGVPLSTVGQLLAPALGFACPKPGEGGRLWQTLCGYAAEGPVLLAVDDIHLADHASRRWLVEAARRVDRSALLLVVTERSQYDIDPPPAGLTHTLPPSLVRTRTIAPLGDEAAAALVRAVRPPAGPDRTADRVRTADCVRAAAGSPLLLHALLEDLHGTPGQPVPDTCAALYPGAYPAAVAWWLENAGPATAEVARTLAALEQTRTPGGDLDPAELLAETAGADPDRVTGWLTAMTRLGLLRPDAAGRPRYAHPLLRDAVLTGWPAARRRAAHRQAAHAMLRRGARVETVARQVLRAGPVGRPWALRVLRDAATLAVDEGRPEAAVGYLRRALDEPLPAGLRQRLLTELGSLEYVSAGAASAIARLAEALHLPAEPRDRVRTAVALGTALAGHGEVRTALRVLRRAEGGLAGHPEPARTVRTASALLSDHDQGQRQETYRWLREAAEHSPDQVGPAGQALLVRYAATAGLIPARDAMERIRALLAEPADPLAEPFLLGTAAAVAQWADELGEAERLVERGLALHRRSLLHPMHHALVSTRADIAAARGDLHRLLEVLADGTDLRAAPGPSTDAHRVPALVAHRAGSPGGAPERPAGKASTWKARPGRHRRKHRPGRLTSGRSLWSAGTGGDAPGQQLPGDLQLLPLHRIAVLQVPQDVLEGPPQGPGAGPLPVQAEDVGQRVEAPAGLGGVVAVVQGGHQVEPGVAGERLGVDGEPGRAVGGEDVVVVQVPVEQPVPGFVRDLAEGGGAVPDQPPRQGSGNPGERPRRALQHAPRNVPEVAQTRRGGDGGEAGQQPGENQHGLAGVLDAAERPGGVQAFEQHRAGGRVVVEQPDRPVAVPAGEGDRFALGLVVQDLELQHGRQAVRAGRRAAPARPSRAWRVHRAPAPTGRGTGRPAPAARRRRPVPPPRCTWPDSPRELPVRRSHPATLPARGGRVTRINGRGRPRAGGGPAAQFPAPLGGFAPPRRGVHALRGAGNCATSPHPPAATPPPPQAARGAGLGP